MYENLGNNIKKFRTKNGITQSELAKMLNKSAITIRKWESNERTPNIETIKDIADIFKVSISELTGDNSYLVNNIDGHDLALDQLLMLVDHLTLEQTKRFQIQKAELLVPILNLLGIYIEFDLQEPGDPFGSMVYIRIPKDNITKELFLEEFLEFMEHIYSTLETEMKKVKNMFT